MQLPLPTNFEVPHKFTLVRFLCFHAEILDHRITVVCHQSNIRSQNGDFFLCAMYHYFLFVSMLLCGFIAPAYSQTAQQKIAHSETAIAEIKKAYNYWRKRNGGIMNGS